MTIQAWKWQLNTLNKMKIYLFNKQKKKLIFFRKADSTLFLSMRKLSANLIQEIHFYVNSVLVWFSSEVAFSAGSKSAAPLRMNFNWQNWSVRWCGSWSLRQSETMIRTQAQRNHHPSLSLSLSPSKHCNKSFISAQASDDDLVSGSA